MSSALIEAGWSIPIGRFGAEPFASADMTHTFAESSLCNVMTGECSTVGGADHAASFGLGL